MQKGLFEPVIIQDQIPLSADRLSEVQAEALARVTLQVGVRRPEVATHLEISTLERILEHLGHLDQVGTVVPHLHLVLWEAEVPAEMALPPEALDL